MNRDPGSLLDMLLAARDVLDFTRGKTFADYEADRALQSAVERQISIIGEAARRVSETFREAHPEIPWRAIIDQRNIIVHLYDELDQNRIWQLIGRYIPDLVTRLEALVPPQAEDDT